MSRANHGGITPMAISTQELGTRALAFRDELRLSEDQVERILNVTSRWRRSYNEQVKPIVRLSDEIDELLNESDLPRERIGEKIQRRTELMRQLDEDFVNAWAELQAVLTPEQWEELGRVYAKEFEGIYWRKLGYTQPQAAVA